MYVKTSDLSKRDIQDLKKAHNVSFPAAGPSSEWLHENGYAMLIVAEMPAHDPETQVVYDTQEVEQVNGVFKARYAVRDKTTEELRDDILRKIYEVETSVTERRKREAILTDEGRAWLEGVEVQIAQLRGELT